MPSPETRPALILQLQGERNELAWREFVSAYEPFLQRLVERQGVPSRHVPDVSQQVLTAIARSVSGWEDDGRPESFRRWLRQVARNIVIKFMTRERREAQALGGTEFANLLHQLPAGQEASQRDSYHYELVLWAAEQVREKFRDASWQAFWKTVIEQKSVEETAAELGVSPGSIYMSRSRIINCIRTRITELSDF